MSAICFGKPILRLHPIHGDLRFTRNGESLFVFVLARPENGIVEIETLKAGNPYFDAKKISSFKLLGSRQALNFTQSADGLSFKLPDQLPGEHAFVIKIN